MAPSLEVPRGHPSFTQHAFIKYLLCARNSVNDNNTIKTWCLSRELVSLEADMYSNKYYMGITIAQDSARARGGSGETDGFPWEGRYQGGLPGRGGN